VGGDAAEGPAARVPDGGAAVEAEGPQCRGGSGARARDPCGAVRMTGAGRGGVTLVVVKKSVGFVLAQVNFGIIRRQSTPAWKTRVDIHRKLRLKYRNKI